MDNTQDRAEAHRKVCTKYRQKNPDLLQEKARMRMRALREREKTWPQETQDARKERQNEIAANYRYNNREQIRKRERGYRHQAYIDLHGFRAFEKKYHTRERKEKTEREISREHIRRQQKKAERDEEERARAEDQPARARARKARKPDQANANT